MRLLLLSLLIGLVLGCQPPAPKEFAEAAYTGELIFTKHARCRMDCRKISEQEIREILAQGKENVRKSDPTDRPCPTKALEGISSDNQEIRVIVAECESTTKIVTVIDLKTDWECACH